MPLQIHRGEQCLQKRAKTHPTKPKNATRDGISRSNGILGYYSRLLLYSLHAAILTSPGYKFESISVLRQPWDPTPRQEIENREEEIVNNSAQYCSVVRTGIGSVRLVIGGEVDAGKPTALHITLV